MKENNYCLLPIFVLFLQKKSTTMLAHISPNEYDEVMHVTVLTGLCKTADMSGRTCRMAPKQKAVILIRLQNHKQQQQQQQQQKGKRQPH